MRKYRSVVMAAACAAALAVPAGAAYAASTPGTASAAHVLTTGKLGGPAVAAGAVLSTSAPKKTPVTFTFLTYTLTCTSSTVKSKVTSNPAAPGTAKESVTAETFGGCTLSGLKGVGIKSITAENLPWASTVSTAKGDPVTVTGSSKTKPIKLVVVVNYSGSKFSCIYAATELKGSASNKDNGITFTKQVFKSQKGSYTLCPATSDGTATYAPVIDTSAKNAKVFVN
jgi:hypothetical protein